MSEDDTSILITSRAREVSPAYLFITFGRKLVVFFKDLEMYLYFSLARFIIWKKVRRDERGKNEKREVNKG